MSETNMQLNFQNPILFNEKLFRREDDLLNVFRESTCYLEEDNSYTFKFDCNQYDSWENITESVGPTVDFRESSSLMRDHTFNFDIPVEPLKTSNSDASEASEFVTHSKEIFTNSSPLSAGKDSLESKPVTNFTSQASHDIESDVQSETAGSKKKKKTTTFSRRKDVIIKTLLRKCRKFYLKDFNKKTSYLKTVKRKFGSSVYKTLLEDYLTKVFKISCSEGLLIFMGVFLYQQDLEDNLDLFVSPNFGPEEIKKLITNVHDILYKYSHQKFYHFSKNEEFKFIFWNFDKIGAEELRKDEEYASGFEIIKGQL